ncbi:CLUMA_CG009887, isoform A [Clunio marinus]|uniref:CLUMA_CG009887, isoform A n=1 Tax=Clunio marinus TaxID=568069 RepID=A0A1J1IAG4_9DIPT|nr:CLUMA_CG009887, isoform A [Clunio marinus]
MDSDKKLMCNRVYETSTPTNLANNLIKSECLKRTLDGLVSHMSDSKAATKSVQDEKVDVSPEISNKKSNDTSPVTEIEKISNENGMSKSFSMQTFATSDRHNQESSPKTDENSDITKSMAFTIDFGSGKVDEQRHKNLLERFQNRHRRGVSLSKVEDEMGDSSSSSQLTAKLKTPTSAKLPRKGLSETSQKPSSASAAVSGVKLREKSKVIQLRDSNKRHSWSPRSSMVEPTNIRKSPNPLERPLKLHNLTKADTKPIPPTTLNIACLQPPLENKVCQMSDDQVSEAGTYTLDGDNYTEEQKEKMNIDKLAMEHEAELLERRLEINETDLEIIDLDPAPDENIPKHAAKGNRRNILEVSFYHQEPSTSAEMTNSKQQKASYLEKLKSKMKNMSDRKFHKSKSPDDDMGTFTSVTTSGVLSVKPTLEVNPKFKRKNSLTKSQIDSSEYVQGIQRLEKNGPITDNDKSIAAGYKLNMLSKQSPTKSRNESNGSNNTSNTSISTATTKDDWIQEWARNAREFSRQKRSPNVAPGMSSSYNFEGSNEKADQFGYFGDDVMTRSDCKPQYEEFGDNLEKYHHKNQHQKKPSTTENHTNNLSNHGSLSSNRGRKVLRDFDLNKEEPQRAGADNFNIKPPISPSRIPSPIGSVSHRQKRFGSNVLLYGSDTDLTNDTELYLQQTAAAISTLQNLQRKNSIRNSSLQSSPISPMSPTRPPIVHSNTKPEQLRANSATRNSIHKRNSSVGSSSRFVPSTIMSTSLQSNHLNQMMKHQKQQTQQHSRHNSYDGIISTATGKKYSQFDQTDDDNDYESMPSRSGILPERQHLSIKQQHHHATKPQQQQQKASPIKRSTSFNIKSHDMSSPARVSGSSGTPKMQNKFVKTFSAPAHGTRIQKSASSSCFNKQMMRLNNGDSYDNEFYINDDDDLNPNQITTSEGSDDDDDDDNDNDDDQKQLFNNNDPLITNTRYNKTFLMRCEQNKKAVGIAAKAVGVIACPNTPEMPRRNLADRTAIKDRSSLSTTRDSSLNRLSDKKMSLTTAPVATKPATVKNTKEVELAMWKRRASYDPLKAAAEGRKKAEEAKRLAQQQQMMMSSESNSSALRSSKSYNCGGTSENWIDDDSSSEFDDEN